MIRNRQDLAGRLQQLNLAMSKALTRPFPDRNTLEETTLLSSIEDAERALSDLDSEISVNFPEYALTNLKAVSSERVQQSLRTDEALLVYATSGQETWLWAVRNNALALYNLKISPTTLDNEVRALRERLDPTRNPSLAPFPTGRAYNLFQNIMEPAHDQLIGVK